MAIKLPEGEDLPVTFKLWRLQRDHVPSPDFIARGGGMLAFDVGVGKTMAALASLQDNGRVRHPIVLVLNTVVEKEPSESSPKRRRR